jgi:glycosyltransferase involved in cell wall biosynthesis
LKRENLASAFNVSRAVRAYTPHGGSLLIGHDTLAGKFYLATEKLLMLRGDLFLFESAYSAEVFRRKIGKPRGLIRVVHNGVSQKEFKPIATRTDATDLVFMGEFRPVKGIDVLIDAIARLLPNVLGDPTGAEDDSHAMGLLEYPHYTRPAEWQGRHDFSHLSMGTSQDYGVAAAEGATIVRVGTVLYRG